MARRSTMGTIKRVWRLAAPIGLCLFVGVPIAPAQESGFGGFFQKLFGAPQAAPAPRPEASPTPRRIHRASDFVPSTTTRSTTSSAQASFHVEVLGDSLAVLAADGLADAFADKPEIGIVDKARDASGLARPDYYDWSKFAAENAAAADKPDFVVIMIGINDGQPIREGGEVIDTLSDKWKERYGARIDALLAPYAAAHIPLAWIGLPPMRADRANAQAVALNELYRQHAEKVGAKFIDVFDAFADQSGQYDAFGPSLEGQNVKLRGADGIHFTKAGARKLANFLESEIRRVYEKRNPSSEVATLPPDIEQAANDINAQILREMTSPPPTPASPAPGLESPGAPPVAAPPSSRPLAGPILPLTAKPTSATAVLATPAGPAVVEPEGVVRVLRKGLPAAPVNGRADDFAWPKL